MIVTGLIQKEDHETFKNFIDKKLPNLLKALKTRQRQAARLSITATKTPEELETELTRINSQYGLNLDILEIIKEFLAIKTINIQETLDAETTAILTDKDLFTKTDGETSKFIIGEQETKKAILLECCKIWVANLQGQGGILVTSPSSVGKSFTCKKIFDLFPDHLKKYRTKISPEAFTYWKPEKNNPDFTWDGKILYLEDASNNLLNSDTFKVMFSEGTDATIVRNQTALDIHIEGKPFGLITTADTNPKNEVLNRFDTLGLDESEEQTQRILERQADLAERTIKIEYDKKIKESLKYLKRVNVVIPFAKELSKSFPKGSLRIRRDFSRFLDLIKASTALHQYQRRQNKEGYYIADKQDYELAKNALDTLKHKNVFGLTHRLKRAYESCCKLTADDVETEFHAAFTAKEIHAFDPFVSERMWFYYIDKLCELKLLEVRTEKREDYTENEKGEKIRRTKKPITVYFPVTKEVIELPEYSKLIANITDITFNSNITFISNNQKSKENEGLNERNEINVTYKTACKSCGGLLPLDSDGLCELCNGGKDE